ncbi:MAG: metallophosphoesterase [Chitinophagaceae bacterium]|nr:MAG: metallophosphoesterase [Chitinophagaceae bacterium]
MRRFLRKIFLRPVLWATYKFSSRPQKDRIFEALGKLSLNIMEEPGKKGVVVRADHTSAGFIIFSDQHKGARNGADDFMQAEGNYLAALEYYNQQGFSLIALGDSEELWENTLSQVKKYNGQTFELEKKFLQRKAFYKVLGNHDLYWGNDPLASWELKKIYGEEVKIYEGLLLDFMINNASLKIFCTHGHQGDAQSDGNWFSKFFVARIWAPLQAYLRINPNTAAYDTGKKILHNEIMYEWSSTQQDMVLITGHTHQPVFASLTHIERLYKNLQRAQIDTDAAKVQDLETEIRKREKEFKAVSVDYQVMQPSYFNSGCCCYVDGDITGIEITGGWIRLVKWDRENKKQDGTPVRSVLEEMKLDELQLLL